jgi:hypothetical protein
MRDICWGTGSDKRLVASTVVPAASKASVSMSLPLAHARVFATILP